MPNKENCQLSFVWVKMRTAAQETAPQIALRGCSKEAVRDFLQGMSKFSRQQARANVLGKCQFVVDHRNPSIPQDNGAGMKNRETDL